MNEKKWHGLERNLFIWHPDINYDACNSCGMCIVTCGSNVFSWNIERNKPSIENPGNCIIGCTTCGKLCPENAITFPEDPKVYVRKIITSYKIFPNVKKELNERLLKFPDHALNGGTKQ